MVLYVQSIKHTNGKKKQKNTEDRKEKKEEKIKRNKNEADMRSGRRSSPEEKVAVCWYSYDQPYDMSS